MFEQEIKRYDQLAKECLERVVKPMGDLEFRKHFEILFSCYSCGIEGSSFSVGHAGIVRAMNDKRQPSIGRLLPLVQWAKFTACSLLKFLIIECG